MRYRTLGRTGLNVSEIGFGAWGISAAQWIGAEEETSLKALMTGSLHISALNQKFVYTLK
jgi:aryl-alcohol dehydrogenase-like predicted oxidoreductase